MAIDLLNGKVRVLNYEMSPVFFPSQHNQQGVSIRGRDEGEDYVIERVALDDIESENTKSDLFKMGRLRFLPEEEDDIYKKLGIEDKENIKSDKELMNILKDSSIDNVRWISNLKSTTLLSRMKKVLFSLECNGMTVHHNISSVVNERINELKYGRKRNEASEINRILKKDQEKREEGKLKETVDELTKKVDTLLKENSEKDEMLSKSQTAISDLLAMVENLKKDNSSTTDKVETQQEKPKTTTRGRSTSNKRNTKTKS